MEIKLDARKRLLLILWLVAFHSLCVGVCLIFLPPRIIELFGFAYYQEKFFPVQGGMFHIVISMVYTLGALNPGRFGPVILLSVIIKFIAFFFLLSYYLFVESIWLVFFSGLMDLFMGAALLWAFIAYKRERS